MLVHVKEIVRDAVARRYAVGAFNTVNLEVTLGIVRAAVAAKSPVIVQVSEKTIRYAELKPIADVIRTVAHHVGGMIPVAMHLDHGRSFIAVRECVDAGFSSVHLDASEQPFEDNIALTSQAVAYAHRAGVWVQGELGVIYGREGLTKLKVGGGAAAGLTDPARVRAYVSASRVDTLAVAIGTLHGAFRGRERLDLKRLADIRRRVALPLVLHGGSGVKASEIRVGIRRGIRIINVDTELRMTFTRTLRRLLRGKRQGYDLRAYLGPATNAIQRAVEEKMRLFNSAGKAEAWTRPRR